MRLSAHHGAAQLGPLTEKKTATNTAYAAPPEPALHVHKDKVSSWRGASACILQRSVHPVRSPLGLVLVPSLSPQGCSLSMLVAWCRCAGLHLGPLESCTSGSAGQRDPDHQLALESTPAARGPRTPQRHGVYPRRMRHTTLSALLCAFFNGSACRRNYVYAMCPGRAVRETAALQCRMCKHGFRGVTLRHGCTVRTQAPYFESDKACRSSADSAVVELVPIRLNIEHEGYRVAETFTWNLNEQVVRPKTFAIQLCHDEELPNQFVGLIASSIEEQLKEYVALMSIDIGPRVVQIRLSIQLGSTMLNDAFFWDHAEQSLTPEHVRMPEHAFLARGLPRGSYPCARAHAQPPRTKLSLGWLATRDTSQRHVRATVFCGLQFTVCRTRVCRRGHQRGV